MRSSNWAFPGPTLEEFLANTSSSGGTYCLTVLLVFIPKIFQKINSLMIFYQFWAPKKRRLLKMKNTNCWKYQQCIFFSNNFYAFINSHVLCFFTPKSLTTWGILHTPKKRFRASRRFFSQRWGFLGWHFKHLIHSMCFFVEGGRRELN